MSAHSLRLIRIFLSSPGDMADERGVACKIIDDLAADPLLRDRVVVRSVAWDQLTSRTPMLATLTPQEAINRRLSKPSECDIMVVLFWSRMGTPLPFPEYKKDDGTPFQSGTEWEYLNAVDGAKKHPHGLPLVAVYRRTAKVMLDSDDPKFDEKRQQHQRVKDFFARFTDTSGAIRGGYNSYETPDDFRKLFEIDVREMIQMVEPIPTAVLPPSPPHVKEPRWTGSPFPGLRAFTPADAPIFFGRGRETDALIQRVKDSRFVAVVGASGSGKSSLVGAGLIPRLKDNAISGEHLGSKDWRIVSFKPGEKEGDPFSALADALVKEFPALIDRPLEAARIKAEFVAALKADPASLADTVAAALAHDPAWAEVLLFIDQFEELFTVVQADLRAPFVELLAALTPGPSPTRGEGSKRLRTVVTMRADFYHACLQYKALEELLRAGSFPLGAPGPIALGEMITRPAERAGLHWEDADLPERILRDTGSEPGSLALMAYTLDELYRACKDGGGGMLTHAAYERMGGVMGAIGTRAETAFAALPGEPSAKEKMLQRVFLALVEVDERGTATRRRAPKRYLLTIEGADALIDYFAGPEVRLLVTSGNGDQAEVEVAHEALLRTWKRLADWIETTQDDQRLVRRFEREALEWLRLGKPDYMRPSAEELKNYHAALDRLGLAELYATRQELGLEVAAWSSTQSVYFGQASREVTPAGERLADLLREFTEPEQARLLRELDDLDTPHARRSAIGERLCAIGDPRSGVGLRPDGLPDMVWCYVDVPENLRGKKIEFIGDEGRFGEFEVKPFYIAKYPTTFVQFQAFLDDPDGWDQDKWWQGLGQKQQEKYEQRFKFANHPRETVSWYQAVAFTRWLTAKLPPEAWPEEALTPSQPSVGRSSPSGRGGIARLLGRGQEASKWEIRLPAEWEWQYAATGGNPANEYPWGPEWDGRRANTTESGLSRTTAVGMYPDGVSPVGALDMSGNVWEWCLNEYDKPANAGTAGNARRVLRGGSWSFDRDLARAVFRNFNHPYFRYGDFGFRVVVASPI